jgi:hypothetical protein
MVGVRMPKRIKSVEESEAPMEEFSMAMRFSGLRYTVSPRSASSWSTYKNVRSCKIELTWSQADSTQPVYKKSGPETGFSAQNLDRLFDRFSDRKSEQG